MKITGFALAKHVGHTLTVIRFSENSVSLECRDCEMVLDEFVVQAKDEWLNMSLHTFRSRLQAMGWYRVEHDPPLVKVQIYAHPGLVDNEGDEVELVLPTYETYKDWDRMRRISVNLMDALGIFDY